MMSRSPNFLVIMCILLPPQSIIGSWLSRCCTARESHPRFFLVDHDPLKLKASVLPMNYAGLGKVHILNEGIAQDGEGV